MLGSLSTFLIPFLLLVAGDARKDFDAALEAVGVEDYAKALDHFEAALKADPDNLRYGSEYRQAVIKTKSYDRCIFFFERLVGENPTAANAFLNYGFAYVDKIPDAGAITQVINANTALTYFSKSLEVEPTWIAYYTRGNSYLFWPKIFNRTHLGVSDLEEALKIQKGKEKKGHHARTYIALGDGYWKMDDPAKAKAVWQEGLRQFPDNDQLKGRLAAGNEEMAGVLRSVYDPNVRVDTNLEDLWRDQ
jgi:tetratricopeptide (TPR) repeat protein